MLGINCLLLLLLWTEHTQGMTLRILSACLPDKWHKSFTCPGDWLTCPPPENMYIILNSMSICQKMYLSIGQVGSEIYLSGWKFYLSRTTGQPLMSQPDTSPWYQKTRIFHFLFIFCTIAISCNIDKNWEIWSCIPYSRPTLKMG